MRKHISVQLDEVSSAALDVLIADGTTIGYAVRAAIVEAAERHPEPAPLKPNQRRPGETYNEWVARQAANAPPLSDYQIYALRATFVERRDHWLTEEQWHALLPGAGSPTDSSAETQHQGDPTDSK